MRAWPRREVFNEAAEPLYAAALPEIPQPTHRRPRVRDLAERCESKILPLFKRRTTEVGLLLPERYLHGLSTGDFDVALRGLLGEGAPLSASSIQRLKARVELAYETWKQRYLSGLEVVYWWADGL